MYRVHFAWRHVYFDEVGLALVDQLRLQGLSVTYSDRLDEPGADAVVVIGIHLFKGAPILRRYRLVGIQTEQIPSAVTSEWRLIRNAKRFRSLQGHYDLLLNWIPGTEFSGSLFLPYGCYRRPIQAIEKKYDVCFIGNIHDNRRSSILRELQKDFHFFPDFSPGLGAEKISAIQQSRILLNLKFYCDGGFEAPRMFDYLSNGAFVVSEFARCTQPFIPGQDFIQFSDISELPSLLRSLLNDESTRRRIADSGYARSQQYTWTEVSHMLLQAVQGCRRKALLHHLRDSAVSLIRTGAFEFRDLVSQLRRKFSNDG